MVVDDEPFNIMAVTGMMVTLGMKMMHLIDKAANGEQAVALMEKAIQENDPNRYRLILTDLSMPFMDGFESSKRIIQMRNRAFRSEIQGARR